MSNSKNKCGWLFGLTSQMTPRVGKSPYDHIFDSGRSREKRELTANEILAREGGQNSLNQPVDTTLDTHIRFTLIYLDGDNKKDFKNAAQWSELKPHLDASAKNNEKGKELEDSIKRIESNSKPLYLLKICDFNSRGLNGHEFSIGKADIVKRFPKSEHNFIGIFRSQSESDYKEADRGGSFGLGKNILWACSGIKTIFGSSRVYPGNKDATDLYNYYKEVHKDEVRLYGHSKLLNYNIGNSPYDGNCYYGEITTNDQGIEIAESLWNKSGLKDLWLDRDDDRYGTSLLVVDYQNPDSPNTGPDKSFKELTEHIEMNFWPAICRSKRRAVFEFYKNSSQNVIPKKYKSFLFDKKESLQEAQPFITAFDCQNSVSKLERKGQVASKTFKFKIPKTSTKAPRKHDEQTVNAELRVYWSDTIESHKHHNYKNTIALVRGFGMVVNYHTNGELENILEEHEDPCFFAVLKVGTAIDDSKKNMDAEQFFKALEPPLHDVWTKKPAASNLDKFYEQPKKCYDDFFKKLHQCYGELIGQNDFESKNDCELLSKLFPFGHIPESKESRSLNIDSSKTKISADGKRWDLTGKVHISRKAEDRDKDWKAKIYFCLANDEGGSDYKVPFDENGFDTHSSERVKTDYEADNMSVTVSVSDVEEFSFRALLNVDACPSLNSIDLDSNLDKRILGIDYRILDK